jgi:5-methylcytosine-specific restriction enzyme subunit McrC
MDIPAQNIYYLLGYAWNKLEESRIIDVSVIATTGLYDLFAKVLIVGTSRLLKTGLDNKVTHNQILKATLTRLTKLKLSVDLKEQIISLSRKLDKVEDITLNKAAFSRAQLCRNDSFCEFLIRICEFIYFNLLPAEEEGPGKFHDFIRDRQKMEALFGEFVRNFSRLEQNQYTVGREDIRFSAGDTDLLPKIQTDASLISSTRKIIIDTKYYPDSIANHYNKDGIKQADILQMYTYLKCQETKDQRSKHASAVLLYFTTTSELDESCEIDGHLITLKTINLNQNWELIHNDLLALISDLS